MDFLNELPTDKRMYFRKLFQNCPEEVLSQAYRRDLSAGEPLVEIEEPCRTIYLILAGYIQAIDWCVTEKPYHIRELGPGETIGEVECFAGLNRFRISAIAKDEVRLAAIPARAYMDWIRTDSKALYMRTQTLMGRLLSQARDARRFMLLDAREEIILYLVRHYENYAMPQGGIEMNFTRERFAVVLGLSVKTIDRNLRALDEMGYVQLKKGGLQINGKQYQMMRQHIEQYIYGDI